MKLYTHTDLDGLACAALLCEVEEVDEVRFVDPGTVQAGKIPFTKNDIIADLPFDKRCGMWFDHHDSSRPKEGHHDDGRKPSPQDRGVVKKFEGCWKDAPSAARVIFDYYENPYLEKYREMVEAADRIDSGQVGMGEARDPRGWLLLSATLETSAEKREDDEYKLYLLKLLRRAQKAEELLADKRVAERAANVKAELELFAKILREHTVMIGKVAYSDLRARQDLPRGNNYLVYSLFPDAVTSVRLMPEKEDSEHVKLSVGHNIYGKRSGFDVGAAMKEIGGGGHKSVGGASVKKEEAEALARKIVVAINEFEK